MNEDPKVLSSDLLTLLSGARKPLFALLLGMSSELSLRADLYRQQSAMNTPV
jgi:hypothetical protein